jgi:hypothetical protein
MQGTSKNHVFPWSILVIKTNKLVRLNS